MTANHRKELRTLWRRFVALVPRKYVQEITAVHLLAPNSGAGIVPNVTETWDLQLSSVSSGNVDHILVHELAHLMTVRKSETTAEPDSTVCPTIPMGYGCARPGSLYDRYTKKFWPKELREETRLPGKRQSYAETFARHPGYFVTPYAAMNPSEDLPKRFGILYLTTNPPGTLLLTRRCCGAGTKLPS